MNSGKAVVGLAALIAVAAAVWAAAPVSATSAVWKHEGKTLAEKVEFELTGSEVIEVGGSVLICEDSATVTTEGGSSAEVVFTVDAGSCSGLAGPAKGCTVTSATSSGSPWALAVNTTDFTLEPFDVTYTLNSGCAVETIEVSLPEVRWVPFEEPSSILLFETGAEGSAEVDGSPAEYHSFGSLQFDEGEAGTYGIG